MVGGEGGRASIPTVGWARTSHPSIPQAMSIREQIGYPNYILEDRNKHLDEEYSKVRPHQRGGPSRAPHPRSIFPEAAP